MAGLPCLVVYITPCCPSNFNKILLLPHHKQLSSTTQHFFYFFQTTIKTTPLPSQWSLSSKPPTTSLSPSRVPSPVPARRPTRRLPRTPTPALALGKLRALRTLISIFQCELTLLISSLTAAKDAVGDAMNESGHNAKADAHKEVAKN